MTQERIRKIHLIYGIATAALVTILSIALIVSCVSIYQSGDRPFSREIIAQALRAMAVPGWICLIMVLGGVILQTVLPLKHGKVKPIRLDQDLLRRYHVNFDQLPAEAQAQTQQLGKRRLKYKAGLYIAAAFAFVFPVIYFADVSHFGVTDITADVINAIWVLLIPLAFVFLAVLWRLHLDFDCINAQIELYKANGIQPGKTEHKEKKVDVTVVRCVIAAVAVIFIILGIVNEGYVDVLGKAIKICTECIGLG